jgi:hypothetical protein
MAGELNGEILMGRNQSWRDELHLSEAGLGDP